MIELNDDYLTKLNRASSKGDQLKWLINNEWYKADNNGYEGLSEYVISKLLKFSSLNKDEYVDYDLDKVKYKDNIYNVCKSKNFLKNNSKIITIKRLIDLYSNQDFYDTYDSLVTIESKAKYLVSVVTNTTRLEKFGEYMYRLAVIDGLFLNEDRHFHNIAVIHNEDNTFDYCPIFDNGAALLSDTKLDYSLNSNTIDLIKTVKTKTFDDDFTNTIDVLEKLYSSKISFYYTEKDIEDILSTVDAYDDSVIKRVKQVLIYQRNKYQYFFD